MGRWLWLAGLRAAGLVANELWDDDARHTLAVRQVEVARSVGALVQLQYALNFLAWTSLDAGEVAVARGYSTCLRTPGGWPPPAVWAGCSRSRTMPARCCITAWAGTTSPAMPP